MDTKNSTSIYGAARKLELPEAACKNTLPYVTTSTPNVDRNLDLSALYTSMLR